MQSQTLPPMSTFRGTAVSSQPGGSNTPHSPVMYNQQLAAHHPHSQHSPAIQNDTIVGKAMQTMFTSTDQSISSFSSNPSTPVNSPPPITSQTQPQAPPSQQQSTANPLHPQTNSNSTWQQLTPVINGSSSTALNGLQNGSYTPELVPRGLHMVRTRENGYLPPLFFPFSHFGNFSLFLYTIVLEYDFFFLLLLLRNA